MARLTRIKLVTSLLAVFLLVSSIFGLVVVMEKMETEAGMIMVGCPYASGHEGLCPMAVADHLAVWRQMFALLPTVVFVLLALAAVFSYSCRSRAAEDDFLESWRGHRRRLFIRKLFDDLARSLAAGIIHPRLYFR